MALVTQKISSEEKSEIALPLDVYNCAFIVQSPDEATDRLDLPHDAARWRLSAELSIETGASITGAPRVLHASLATIVLPAVHHKNQLVAFWRWPLAAQPSMPGRVTTVTFRWESDVPRASASASVLALRGARSDACGLFALPFPGPTEILNPFDRRRR